MIHEQLSGAIIGIAMEVLNKLNLEAHMRQHLRNHLMNPGGAFFLFLGDSFRLSLGKGEGRVRVG